MFAHLIVKEERVSPPNTTSYIMESYQDNDDNVQIINQENVDMEVCSIASAQSSDPQDQPQLIPIQKKDAANEFSNENRSILLISLLKETRRIHAGLNYIIEFQSKNYDSSEARYYCELCFKAAEQQEIVKHCTSLSHIFRFFKTYMPIEYKRILNRNVRQRVDIIKKIIKKLHNHLFESFKPKLKVLDNISDAYYDELDKFINSEPLLVEDNVELDILNATEEENDNVRNESIFSNIKRCRSPTNNLVQSNKVNNNNNDNQSSSANSKESSSNENQQIQSEVTTNSSVNNNQESEPVNMFANLIIKPEPCDFEELPINVLKRRNDNSDTHINKTEPDIKRVKYDSELDEARALINDILDDKLNIKFDKNAFYKIKNNIYNLNLDPHKFSKLISRLDMLLRAL